MNKRALIPLLVGLGVGVFAIKMVVDVVRKAHGSTSVETIPVVVATTDIAPTLEIREAMLKVVKVPKALVPKLAFTEPQELIGRVASHAIPNGLPIVSNLLAPKGTPAGMAVRIPEGFRAVAVQVDEYVGVAGWIKPGSHVDVVAVMTAPRGTGRSEQISKIILQNIEVLAVGADIGSGGEGGATVTKSVTVLVAPEQVSKLHLAATKGKLRLAMRSPDDQESVNRLVTTDADLLLDQQGPVKSSGGGALRVLSHLFAKDPKPAPEQTDKTAVTPPVEPPAPPVQAVAAVEQKPEWVIEVLSGPQSYAVRFEDSSGSARRLDAPGGAGPAREAAALPPGPHAPALDLPAIDVGTSDFRLPEPPVMGAIKLPLPKLSLPFGLSAGQDRPSSDGGRSPGE